MVDLEKTKVEVNGKEITVGCVLESDGSTAELKTGAWRSRRPIVDHEECIECGTCWMLCPEGCIEKTSEDEFVPDMDYCKGCGICGNECPVDCIEMVIEEK